MAENRAMNCTQSPSKKGRLKRQWKKESQKFEKIIATMKKNLSKVSKFSVVTVDFNPKIISLE